MAASGGLIPVPNQETTNYDPKLVYKNTAAPYPEQGTFKNQFILQADGQQPPGQLDFSQPGYLNQVPTGFSAIHHVQPPPPPSDRGPAPNARYKQTGHIRRPYDAYYQTARNFGWEMGPPGLPSSVLSQLMGMMDKSDREPR